MARRGKFGRLPRALPSISSTIISIAQEMQSRRDQNLMDAWQKGGEFEGHPATDELVLAHWRERLKGIAKDDPLYDTYKDTLTQYTYSIAESKASTAYAQGKLSDSGMAQFYLGWSKKVPHNTEFYRVLQRDAAQFMRAAKTKAAAAAKQAAEDAYQRAQQRDYDQHEKSADYLTDVLRNMARGNGLIGAGTNSDLTEFDPNDPAAMMRLLSQINPSSFEGSKGEETLRTGFAGGDVLFHDPVTGKAVTANDVAKTLKGLDPHFDGRITLDYYRTVMNRAIHSQGVRFDRATKTGHTTDANALKKAQEYTAELGREANIWPVEQSYNMARQTFLSTWMDSTATPDMKLQAFQEYATTLTSLASGKNVDDNTRSRLLAEAQGDSTVSSLAEDFTGLSSQGHDTTGGQAKGDISETWQDVQRYALMQQAVSTGQGVWTTGQTDAQGTFHPTPGGREIGAATLAEVQQSSDVQPVVIFVPQGGMAKPIPVVVGGGNITAGARNADGTVMSSTDKNAVGSFYDVTVGGLKTRVYAYRGSDGHVYYTTSTPWDDNAVKATQTKDGLVLDFSAFVPHQDQGGNWVYPNGQPASLQTGGGGPFSLSTPNNQGEQHLVLDPSAMTYSSDPARAAAGPDPSTDFFSPTLAALTSTPEGLKVLATLRDDPVFKQQLMLEAQNAAMDATTGVVDPNALSKYTTQINLATHLPEAGNLVTGFLKTAGNLWDRLTTNPTFATVTPQQATQQQLGHYAEVNSSTLPSDKVRGTQFGALGSVFTPTTNLIKDFISGVEGNLKLQVNGTIKVPQPPAGNVTPQTFAPAPAPTTTPITVTVPPTTSTPVQSTPTGYVGDHPVGPGHPY